MIPVPRAVSQKCPRQIKACQRKKLKKKKLLRRSKKKKRVRKKRQRNLKYLLYLQLLSSKILLNLKEVRNLIDPGNLRKRRNKLPNKKKKMMKRVEKKASFPNSQKKKT